MSSYHTVVRTAAFIGIFSSLSACAVGDIGGPAGQPGVARGGDGADPLDYLPAPKCPAASPDVAARDGWRSSNASVPADGVLRFELEARPTAANLDGLVAVGAESIDSFDKAAIAVRFADDGLVDVRDGAFYTSDMAYPYEPGVWYSIGIVADIDTQTYDVEIGPCGEPRETLVEDASFRDETLALSTWAAWSSQTAALEVSTPAWMSAGGCAPATCESLGQECGQPGDGCGGTLNCGGCEGNELCDSGVCVEELMTTPPPAACVPDTCEGLGIECGVRSDGCGDYVACGGCQSGSSCNSGVCVQDPVTSSPPPACEPDTCESVYRECGVASDGCGGALSCGACPSAERCTSWGTCVADSSPPPACVPHTCQSLGRECGSVSDGCGGTLSCGGCQSGSSCNSGACIQVSSCEPDTCESLYRECGSVSDGCGGTLSCGGCQSGSSCNSGVCVQDSACERDTCAMLGAECGTLSDGCGGTLSCGSCGVQERCSAEFSCLPQDSNTRFGGAYVAPVQSNTGPTNRGILTRYSGPNPVTTNGAVLENFWIEEQLEIAADNVTIRNFSIRQNHPYHAFKFTGAENFLVEDGEVIDGPTPSAKAVYTSGNVGGTFRRLHIDQAGEDSFHITGKTTSDVIIESTLITRNGSSLDCGKSHADAIQTANFQGTIRVMGSRVVPAYTCGCNGGSGSNGWYKQSNVFQGYDGNTSGDNYLINNWLDGSSNNLIGGDSKGSSTTYLRDNKFGNFYQYGLWGSGPFVDLGGNTFECNGTPVTGPKPPDPGCRLYPVDYPPRACSVRDSVPVDPTE